jgi:hypothetical protein
LILGYRLKRERKVDEIVSREEQVVVISYLRAYRHLTAEEFKKPTAANC